MSGGFPTCTMKMFEGKVGRAMARTGVRARSEAITGVVSQRCLHACLSMNMQYL